MSVAVIVVDVVHNDAFVFEEWLPKLLGLSHKNHCCWINLLN